MLLHALFEGQILSQTPARSSAAGCGCGRQQSAAISAMLCSPLGGIRAIAMPLHGCACGTTLRGPVTRTSAWRAMVMLHDRACGVAVSSRSSAMRHSECAVTLGPVLFCTCVTLCEVIRILGLRNPPWARGGARWLTVTDAVNRASRVRPLLSLTYCRCPLPYSS